MSFARQKRNHLSPFDFRQKKRKIHNSGNIRLMAQNDGTYDPQLWEF